jgi:hypothetical protein
MLHKKRLTNITLQSFHEPRPSSATPPWRGESVHLTVCSDQALIAPVVETIFGFGFVGIRSSTG